MRIVIEIDGTPVVATEVPTPAVGPAFLSGVSSEPPVELARAARALDAQSAGPAAFVRPVLAEFRAPTLETTALAAGSKPGADFAAGVAAAITAHSSKTSRAVPKRSPKRAK
jgi:hypothetical protein